MKAISLWQPWATLVAIGAKQYETRSWSTNYRGPLAIHAAQRWTPEQKEIANTGFIGTALRAGGYRVQPLGCFVCICDLVDILPTELVKVDLLESSFGDFSPGRFAWKLKNIRILEPVKPWPGRQRLWAVSDKLIVALQERVKVEAGHAG